MWSDRVMLLQHENVFCDTLWFCIYFYISLVVAAVAAVLLLRRWPIAVWLVSVLEHDPHRGPTKSTILLYFVLPFFFFLSNERNKYPQMPGQ